MPYPVRPDEYRVVTKTIVYKNHDEIYSTSDGTSTFDLVLISRICEEQAQHRQELIDYIRNWLIMVADSESRLE